MKEDDKRIKEAFKNLKKAEKLFGRAQVSLLEDAEVFYNKAWYQVTLVLESFDDLYTESETGSVAEIRIGEGYKKATILSDKIHASWKGTDVTSNPARFY